MLQLGHDHDHSRADPHRKRNLLTAVAEAAAHERSTTVRLIALLAELDARRLYLGEGCSSLFTYCTQALHLSADHGSRARRRLLTALGLDRVDPVRFWAATSGTHRNPRQHVVEEFQLALLLALLAETAKVVDVNADRWVPDASRFLRTQRASQHKHLQQVRDIERRAILTDSSELRCNRGVWPAKAYCSCPVRGN